MASGSTLAVFEPIMNKAPTSNPATFDERNGILVLEFDPGATPEVAIFKGRLPRNYSGLGITVNIQWMGEGSVTTGDVVWGASFERQDTGTDLDSDSFASEKTATATTSGTAGASAYTDIAFSNGAEIDSLSVGEEYRIKIRRVSSDAADTMNSNDAQLVSVELRET